MVEDAKTFGMIATANALSDIYAMGGKPLYALNIVCFPKSADQELLQEILIGGAEKCNEAGALLVGGHSIYDDTLKYGLAVTGIVETDKFYRNNTPRVGDALILTKPLGVGVITAAYRGEEADEADVNEAIASMTKLNKYAAESIASFNISACTDVTGFGLIGHLLEMTAGNVSAELVPENIPHLSNVKKYIDDDWITGGGTRNRLFTSDRVDVSKIPKWMAELVFDPQTSGGLLIAVDKNQSDDLLKKLQKSDPLSAIIGKIIKRNENEITWRKP